MPTQTKQEKDIEQLKKDVGELKQSVALLNQFNGEVLKPTLEEMKALMKDVITRSEFDDLKEEVNGKVNRVEVYAVIGTITLLATIVGVILNIIKFGSGS